MKLYRKLILPFVIILFLGILFIFLWNSMMTSESNSTITLATTTSTENSGLLDHLHPEMTKDTGITVDVLAVGTGAALEHARKGLADVVMVHARSLEDQFIKEGYGIHRVSVMYNNFIIVGPSEDPAKIRGLTNSIDIYLRLYEARDSIIFVSRGDNSGTHVKEIDLWNLANITIQSDNFQWIQNNPWYLETGAGMGQTLTTASEFQAYTLTDRGTWLFIKNGLNLELLAQGSISWQNPYSAILVNPTMFQSGLINYEMAKNYVKWLISPKGQSIIDNYTILDETAFFADFLDHIDEMAEEELDFWGIEPPNNITHLFEPTNVQNSISIKSTKDLPYSFTNCLKLEIIKSDFGTKLLHKENFPV
jgi:tungstate transport system substrate-binding protein